MEDDPITEVHSEAKILWRTRLRKWGRWLFLLPVFWLYGLPFVEEHLFHFLPSDKYRLDLKEAIVLSLLLELVHKVGRVELRVEEEASRGRRIWIDTSRDAAHVRVCELLRRLSYRVTSVDLLQFSGDTSIPVLKEIAESCATAKVRLFLISRETAEKYDEPGFHWNRIEHTKGVLRVIKEDHPQFSVELWSYATAPSIAGIIVDNWLVTVGWYTILPHKTDENKLSIRGHAAPAVTAIDDQAQPLLRMVRDQFDAVKANAKRESQ
jgi:hypothetical protein